MLPVAGDPLLWFVTDATGITLIFGVKAPLLYDLEADPKLEKNIAKEYPHICERMKDLAIADAGGKVPEFLRKLKGEPECTPLLVE